MARAVWEPAPYKNLTADTVLNPQPVVHDVDQQDAEAVIHTLLDEETWPLAAKAALDAGRAHGIPERTMRCAARRLGIRIEKFGFRAGWRWLRPAPEAATAPAASTPPPPDADPAPPKRHEAASVSVVAPSGDSCRFGCLEGAICPFCLFTKTTTKHTKKRSGNQRVYARARASAVFFP